MPLGEFKLLQWKSKAQQQEDAEKYEKWAFPHGQKQRDNLEALMREVEPKEKLPFIMMGYLTCKELYEKHLKTTGSNTAAIDTMLNVDKKYTQIIKKKELTKYLALVLADAEIDETCEYPSVETIRERIVELDKLKIKRR